MSAQPIWGSTPFHDYANVLRNLQVDLLDRSVLFVLDKLCQSPLPTLEEYFSEEKQKQQERNAEMLELARCAIAGDPDKAAKFNAVIWAINYVACHRPAHAEAVLIDGMRYLKRWLVAG